MKVYEYLHLKTFYHEHNKTTYTLLYKEGTDTLCLNHEDNPFTGPLMTISRLITDTDLPKYAIWFPEFKKLYPEYFI